MIRRILALTAAVAICGVAPPRASVPLHPASREHLAAPQRAALQRYLGALAKADYAGAFAALEPKEQRYFGTSANYASGYEADRVKIKSFVVLGSQPAPRQGAIAIVSENVEFFDHAHQATGSATVKVAYGVLRGASGYRIKDPNHPWLALVPPDAAATVQKLRVTVRKLSFFTGRVEAIVTFANVGDTAVTLLPYLRTVLRDDRGAVYHLIETRLPGLTDRRLRLGLPLAGSAQYTGALTFFTPNRFTPKSLILDVAPNLREGSDAPFHVLIPPMLVPA